MVDGDSVCMWWHTVEQHRGAFIQITWLPTDQLGKRLQQILQFLRTQMQGFSFNNFSGCFRRWHEHLVAYSSGL